MTQDSSSAFVTPSPSPEGVQQLSSALSFMPTSSMSSSNSLLKKGLKRCRSSDGEDSCEGCERQGKEMIVDHRAQLSGSPARLVTDPEGTIVTVFSDNSKSGHPELSYDSFMLSQNGAALPGRRPDGYRQNQRTENGEKTDQVGYNLKPCSPETFNSNYTKCRCAGSSHCRSCAHYSENFRAKNNSRNSAPSVHEEDRHERADPPSNGQVAVGSASSRFNHSQSSLLSSPLSSSSPSLSPPVSSSSALDIEQKAISDLSNDTADTRAGDNVYLLKKRLKVEPQDVPEQPNRRTAWTTLTVPDLSRKLEVVPKTEFDHSAYDSPSYSPALSHHSDDKVSINF